MSYINFNLFNKTLGDLYYMEKPPSILNGKIENSVEVELLGGTVHIDWDGTKDNTNQSVFMTGPAEYVFEAEIK